MQQVLVFTFVACLHCDLMVVEHHASISSHPPWQIQVCDGNCDNIVQHDCLTYEGQAGSAMWSGSGHNQSIHAIATGARSLSDGTTQNVGIKLNAFVYNTLSAWYNEDASENLSPGGPVPVPPSSPASHPKSDHDTREMFFN